MRYCNAFSEHRWVAGGTGRGPRRSNLPSRRPGTGKVCRFHLQDINRSPNGMVGGVGTMTIEDRGSPDLSFEELMQIKRLTLYCLENDEDAEVLLVFLRIGEDVDLLAEPFLDRGVRKLADAGDVFITTLSSAEAYSLTIPEVDASKVSWVWNTGRCGSTLLHRLLLAAGVCSSSEPYWLEQLCWRVGTQQDVPRLLSVCVRLHCHLLRQNFCPTATHYAFNFKGPGHRLLDIVAQYFPTSRHFYMYRDTASVVESFQSIFYQDLPWSKRPAYLLFGRGPVTPRDAMHAGLRGLLERKELPLPWKPAAAKTAVMWIDSMCTWLEVSERRAFGERKLILRMDEFVKQQLRVEVVEAVLRFVYGEQFDAAALMPSCVGVFDQHSQKGDRMEKSSAKTGHKFLNWFDRKQIRHLVASVPFLMGVYEDGVLHGSFLTR